MSQEQRAEREVALFLPFIISYPRLQGRPQELEKARSSARERIRLANSTVLQLFNFFSSDHSSML